MVDVNRSDGVAAVAFGFDCVLIVVDDIDHTQVGAAVALDYVLIVVDDIDHTQVDVN
jgi:hypothetical protein